MKESFLQKDAWFSHRVDSLTTWQFLAAQAQSFLVLFRRVQVSQGQEIGVCVFQLIRGNNPGTQLIDKKCEAEAANSQKRITCGQDRRPPVECRERMKKFITARYGQVVIADQLCQPVDPGWLEERHVRGCGVGQFHVLGQYGESCGQPLQRPLPPYGIAGDDHRLGQSRNLLIGGRDDHDRAGHGRHQTHHALEHPLGTEGQPGLGLAHPPAFASAQDHRSHDHA